MEEVGMRSNVQEPLPLWQALMVWSALLVTQAFAQQPQRSQRSQASQPSQAGQTSQTSQPVQPQGLHLINKYKVGGEGGWDYLSADSIARRLYIARSNRVIVFDLDQGTVAGEIPDTNGVHGVAVANDLGRGFARCGQDGKVLIFDLKTLKPLAEVRVGTNPDAIIYDLATTRVFAFNGGSSDATAIDAAKGTVVGTIPLGGKPEFAASDGRGTVY